MENKVLIEARQLTKIYKQQKAISNVNFEIEKGKIYGLIGPNGAGKTTIMKMLAGLILPTSGECIINGKKSEKEISKERKKMSFMIETPYAKMNLTGWQNLEMQRIQKGITDKSRINKVMEMVGLQDCGNKLVKQFSLGMRQRLGIANALLSNPEIMVLDEPVNGLDPQGMAEIRNLILRLNKEQNITILISSHILTELSQMCTDYIFINKGQILEKISSEKLHQKCSTHYTIKTDKNSEVPNVFEKYLQTKNYELMDNGVYRLYDYVDDAYKVSRALIDNGITPIHLAIEEANLEEYYINILGGKNIE